MGKTASLDTKIYEKVDKAIKKDALQTLNQLRYNITSCKSNIATLAILRNILEAKDKCSECYKDYSREQIVNLIKKHL